MAVREWTPLKIYVYPNTGTIRHNCKIKSTE